MLLSGSPQPYEVGSDEVVEVVRPSSDTMVPQLYGKPWCGVKMCRITPLVYIPETKSHTPKLLQQYQLMFIHHKAEREAGADMNTRVNLSLLVTSNLSLPVTTSLASLP